ncbi:hypothetical protein WEI85_41385 [Actinomycetes bacterium KLBMP 9797]
MRWLWRSSLLASAVVATIAGVGAPAQATVPPKNVGWLYTVGNGGAAFFDADLAGHPGWEKITVCDNVANSRGVGVAVYGDLGQEHGILDPSSERPCASMQGNLFPDGYGVAVHVFEYRGDLNENYADGWGVA